MIARVSHLAAYKRWREDEDSDVGWLLNLLRSGTETEAMQKGTAFHAALEVASESESESITSDGYTFHFTADMEVPLPPVREQRRSKDYGGIIVTGQADGIIGKTIVDYKTTEQFEAERYLTGMQHKFYMDIFGCDRFQWFIFEMKEMKEAKNYCVHAMHRLEQFRYPEMTDECRDLAMDFKAFAEQWLPGWTAIIEPRRPAVISAPRDSGQAPTWEMRATKGRNLIGVGWRDGVLRCAFAAKDGERFYCYRDVPEAEFHKIISNPFPDRLFATNIKGKYEVMKEAA